MLRFLKRWRRRPAPAPARAPDPATADDVRAFLAAPRVYGPLDDRRLREMPEVLRRATLDSAARALAHRFNLLGSGPYQPIDPDRPARSGYTPIDWALDPVAHARFPNDRPSAGCDIASIRPPGGDIKRPWELARCYHWITLAQAWRLTRDERFARELFQQCDDFMEANPPGRGVQWTCTMDVAIRAANWLVAFELVRDAPIDDRQWIRAVDALLGHGRFIRSHLENHYEVTSNHFLSNVIGLLLLGLGLAHRGEARDWTAFAIAALQTEMQVQVLPDGMDFESSIPYHRLVTELFFAGWRAARVSGAALSQEFEARLRQMHTFMAAVLRPDGLMPQFGDADDGRLHMFRGHDTQPPQDPRHLFGPAAAAFAHREWVSLAGDAAAWDAFWWGLESPAEPFSVPPVRASFPDAGLVVQRDRGGDYLLIANARVGTRGFGNHKHNDLLSFEYHASGRAIVVDPGSYVYTSDPDARNLLRSIQSHSSIAPAGAEPNDFKPEWLFRMFERAIPELVEYDGTDTHLRYAGRHNGFADRGVEITRRFEWRPGRLELQDEVGVAAGASVPMEWRFQLAPDVRAQREAPGSYRLESGGVGVRLAYPAELSAAVESAWYSPSYGVRLPSSQIVCRGTCDGGSRTWRFALLTVAPAPPR